MAGEGIDFKVFIDVSGGRGGPGGPGDAKGGPGGVGEGPTFNFKGVQNVTNNVVNQGQGLKEVLYKWLESPPDTKDRQYELRKLHHGATGHWLLCDGRFVRWKDSPGSLWIKGISGTGKSVLSSTVIEEIVVARPGRSAVAYFYFDFRNERQLGTDIMLRSIIWQLSGRSPSPYSSLEKLYKKLAQGTVYPQALDLQEVLEDLLSESDNTYIIIDGLDECTKTDLEALVKFLCNLCHPTKDVLHLLFTSQPLDEFKQAFKGVTSIELDFTVTTNDIRSLVENKVSRVKNWAHNDDRVTEQIVQKSNGMFRMAACLLIELEHCYEDEWQETLAALPSDLFGIYSHFLTRAKASLKPAFIQGIFRWLVFSARQVTSDELADAIAFRLDDPAFDFSDPAKSTYYPKRRPDNSNNFKLLEGLIVINHDDYDSLPIYRWGEPSISLAHSSVRDYILSLQFQQQFGSFFELREDVSHKFITQTCVRYLLLFAEPNHLMSKDTVSDYSIALYAAEYWFHHLQLCNDQDQEALLPLTMSLLKDGSSQYTALYQLRPIPKYSTRVWNEPILPTLCMCSEMGYTVGVHSLLIEKNTSVDLATTDGLTVLHLASINGHIDIARLLIKHNASLDLVDKYGWTALHLASRYGHLNIVRLLIEYNAPVDLVKKDGWTVLHLASRYSHLDIVRLLIEHNASLDLVDKDG